MEAAQAHALSQILGQSVTLIVLLATVLTVIEQLLG